MEEKIDSGSMRCWIKIDVWWKTYARCMHLSRESELNILPGTDGNGRPGLLNW